MVDNTKGPKTDVEQIKVDLIKVAENLEKTSKRISKFAAEIEGVIERKSKTEIYGPNQARKQTLNPSPEKPERPDPEKPEPRKPRP